MPIWKLALETNFEMWFAQERSWLMVRHMSLKDSTSSIGLSRKYKGGVARQSFQKEMVRVRGSSRLKDISIWPACDFFKV